MFKEAGKMSGHEFQVDTADQDKIVTEQPAPRGAAKSDAPRPTQRRSAPKWEEAARGRLRDNMKRYTRPISNLRDRDANEGDTCLFVTDFLCDVLGYDKYSDLTTEYAVRGQYADYGIRIDTDLIAFIEVKRAATKLNARHLNQVQTYALNEGVEWLILTNGWDWRAYHVVAGLPVEVHLAIEANLLAGDSRGKLEDQLFYLTKESLSKRQIDEVWRQRLATSPESLANVVASSPVAKAIRLELWRQTSFRVDDDEVLRLLRESVIREGLLKGQ